MNAKQKKVVEFLESLVHKRFSKEQLNKVLSDFFKEKIKVENISRKDDELADYNLLFASEKKETYGYFDIYFLKMRRKGFDGATMYITEVSYEFE
jgi:hypothetical protein